MGRSLMMSWCVPTVQLTGGRERRGTAYAGMDLQPSAKDCIRLWHGGREGGMKHTGVGGERSETKEAGIARRRLNRVSSGIRYELNTFYSASKT